MDSAPNLSGRRLLITSGPTRARIDAVRYISNRSSGRLGARIADEALAAGAAVAFVRGPDSARPAASSPALEIIDIETVEDARRAVVRVLTSQRVDAVVHLMAVLDYAPAETSPGKTPSGREEWLLRLVRTPKIIQEIRRLAPEAYLASFKLEVNKSDEELARIALESLRRNGSQLVVANDLSRIEGERHPACFVDPEGRIVRRCQTKTEIARELIRCIASALSMP